jgi:glycyl-tRNA synthetase beta chain
VNLLLEIGAEEIPDGMLAGALEYLKGAVGDLLKQQSIGDGTSIRTDATPRRLVVRVEGITPRKPDAEERVWGPARSAPPAAVAGFARKQGVAADELEVLSDGKVEKFSLLRKIPGRAAVDILGEALPQLVLKTPFPKTMYWTGKGGVRFIRPIRWIVALLDDAVIPIEIAGVAAGNESSGATSKKSCARTT